MVGRNEPVGGEFPTEIPLEGHFGDFLRWRRQRRGLIKMHEARGEVLPEVSRNGHQILHSSADSVTWSGHAGVITRLDQKTVLSDPVWAKHLAFVVKRLSPPAPEWDEVPTPNLVTISHNHYDHLDSFTMRRIKRDTPVAVPKGVGDWFRRRRFRNVHEFSWWETRDIDGLRVTFVPSQHFSGRTLWDRNKSYFGGWVVEGKRHTLYHSGDTGYFPGFQEIGRRFPKIDVACLPIGAYEPRWFMRAVHTDPDEAGQAFLDMRAARMLPIHWGTFRLTDEAMDEPPKRIRAFMEAKKVEPERLLLPRLGEPIALDDGPRADVARRNTETRRPPAVFEEI